MGHPHPLPADPSAALPLVEERLRSYSQTVEEFRDTMSKVQMQLGRVATGEQVEAMRREVLAKVDGTERRVEAAEREALSMRLTLHGPPGQPELGLISRFGTMAERVKEAEKRWDRMVGYVIGAAAGGGLLSTLAQQVFTK